MSVKYIATLMMLFVFIAHSAEEKKAKIHLQVVSKENAQDSILAKVEKENGYLIIQEPSKLVVALPQNKMAEFLDSLAITYLVIDREEVVFGLNQEYKEKLLDQYFEILKKSSSIAFVEVEREIQNMINEIET